MTTTKQETHTHCWHTPDVSLTRLSYPPQVEEVCCHCGARRYEPVPEPEIPPGHGRFYPHGLGKLTVRFDTNRGGSSA